LLYQVFVVPAIPSIWCNTTILRWQFSLYRTFLAKFE